MRAIQPSLRDFVTFRLLPGVETPGYSQILSGTNDVRSASTKILFTFVSLSGTKVVGHAQLRGGEGWGEGANKI
jgi:hypothetical protein